MPFHFHDTWSLGISWRATAAQQQKSLVMEIMKLLFITARVQLSSLKCLTTANPADGLWQTPEAFLPWTLKQ